MKFGVPPRPTWYASSNLNNRFNKLNNRLNRLLILEHVWTQLVGNKAKFWVLHAVQNDTLYVKVRVAVAKNELVARRSELMSELNKHFDKPWIKRIEIN
ncbi:MAG: DUF721 domain-containing protein [Elusimicrobiaceae bacterium]|nr:DUF721 domain-containing protein [Elusimicrobiaceae bacterium]